VNQDNRNSINPGLEWPRVNWWDSGVALCLFTSGLVGKRS